MRTPSRARVREFARVKSMVENLDEPGGKEAKEGKVGRKDENEGEGEKEKEENEDEEVEEEEDEEKKVDPCSPAQPLQSYYFLGCRRTRARLQNF